MERRAADAKSFTIKASSQSETRSRSLQHRWRLTPQNPMRRP
jgi:hypothetical protein